MQSSLMSHAWLHEPAARSCRNFLFEGRAQHLRSAFFDASLAWTCCPASIRQQVVSQVVIVMLVIAAAPALRLLHQIPCHLGFLSCHCVKDALCSQVYALIAIACAKLGHIVQHHSRKSKVGPVTSHAAFPNPGFRREFLDDPFCAIPGDTSPALSHPQMLPKHAL